VVDRGRGRLGMEEAIVRAAQRGVGRNRRRGRCRSAPVPVVRRAAERRLWLTIASLASQLARPRVCVSVSRSRFC
jgi:hypothetical protein